MRTFVLIAGGAAALVALFLVLRPGDDAESTRPATATVGRTPTRTSGETTTTTPRRPPGPTVIRIRIRRGEPVGGVKRATLEKGDRAVIFVTSDVSDHVHLHGYDRFADVAPRRPARLRFRATIPGRFEAELEDRGVQILDLEVRP